MQSRHNVGSGRIHPTLEMRHSTLSRGTIEDIPIDQVDLVQASSLYGRQHTEERHLSRDPQPRVLQSRPSALSESHVPYQISRSRGNWLDQQGKRKEYIQDLQLFVRQHFHQKECCLFVPAINQKANKVRNLKCHCGEVLMDHAGMRNTDEHAPAKAENLFIGSLYLIPKELRPYISSHKLEEEPSARMPVLHWGKENIRTTVTGTYGEIDFVNVEHHGGKKPAKFVRISDEDSVDFLMELMEEHWKIMEPQAPHLVISVVGGAKNFKLDGRMRDTFSTGLIKTAKTTSAWLITSGFNMGVMKAVGQAVRQGQSFCWDNDQMSHVLRCIGIAPWGYVMDRKKLESDDGMGRFNVNFRMSNTILHGQPVPLNADHTHFVFVDDGYRNRYGGVAALRSKFEQKVFKPVKDGGLGIPVVLVVVEGGTDAIADAKSSLEHDIPVVVCSSTGRAADIIAYAYSHAKPMSGGMKEMNPKHLRKLREKISDAYGKSWKENEKEDKIDGILSMVKFCCEKSNLITVFNMNKQEDLDLAILSALLKATSGASEDQRLKQVKLALTWNRVDIAQEEIFREDVLWKPGSLDETLFEAIMTDKIKFIELILQQGSVIMKDFLTVSRLNELYMKVPKYHFVYRLLYKLTRKEELTRENIQQLLCKLLDSYTVMARASINALLEFLLTHYHTFPTFENPKTEAFRKHCGKRRKCWFVDNSSDHTRTELDSENSDTDDRMEVKQGEKPGFKSPYKQLMVWAVLMHRQNLAKFCWEMGDEPVTSAIAMTRLYDAVSRYIGRDESELKDTILLYKDEFEELATAVLNECHQKDPEKAMMIVERHSPIWDEMTCLQIAAASNDQIFIASEACLNSVDTTWKSGILSRWFKVLLSVFCPLVAIFSMDFIEGKKNLTWYQKLGTFFTAPTTKFIYRMILYILFLCLHTYMVLVDFKPHKVTPLEIVCTVWILAFVVDKIHTLFAFPSPTLKSKFRDFFGLMDYFEAVNYLMCFIGFISHMVDYPMVAKVFYCTNAVIFIINLTRYYTASPILGPKLIMITRMMKELFMFLIVLLVFLLAYGISSQGLLYKERSPDWVILKDIVYFPYWQLYGELFLEEIDTGDCSAGSMDCRTFHWLVPILLGVYLLVGNILLLTLLIAIFSNVFDSVEQNAQTISKYYMYFIVMEYDVKVFIAPPLSIIQHIYLMVRWIFKHTCCKKEKEKQTLGKRHLEYLQLFEKEMMTNMLRQKKENELASLETTVTSLQKRVDDLTKLIEDEVIADAQTGQTATPFLQTREPSIMENPQSSIISWSTTGTSQVWPSAQEVISVKDKVMNTAIPSDYLTKSIPPLKKSESSALLVLPTEEGSSAFMTIPVTLSGEKSGDSTKIMVQELRQSVRGVPGTPQNTLKHDHTDIEQTGKDSEISEKTDVFLVDNKQNNDVVDVDDIQDTQKVRRRGSSKKRKKDKKSKRDETTDINNVNRPHSSVDRGAQRVHFLLPDDESEAPRPKTAGHAARKDVEEYPVSHGFNEQGHFEITDLSAIDDGTSDKIPLTAWAEEQTQNSVTITNPIIPVNEVDSSKTDGRKEKKKKKKKKKKKEEDEEA